MSGAMEELVQKYFEGALVEGEAEALRAWLSADAAHLDEFIAQVDLHDALFEYFAGVQTGPDEQRGKVVRSARLRAERAARRLRKRAVFTGAGWVTVAAAILVTLGAALLAGRGRERDDRGRGRIAEGTVQEPKAPVAALTAESDIGTVTAEQENTEQPVMAEVQAADEGSLVTAPPLLALEDIPATEMVSTAKPAPTTGLATGQDVGAGVGTQRQEDAPAVQAGAKYFVAAFSVVKRDVCYRRSGGEKSFRAAEGVNLNANDVVDARAGWAQVELPGKARLYVNKQTTVTMSERSLQLSRGEICLDVYCPGQQMEIRTRDAAVRCMGTKFSVRTAPGYSVVTVAKGVVEVENEKGKVEAGEGSQVTVRKGQAPAKPRKVDTREALAWVQSVVAAGLTRGLAGYWRFDEGTGDTVGDALWKGYVGHISKAAWADGVVGKALSFVGKKGYDTIDVGNPEALQLTGAMTLSTWVFVSDFSTNGHIVSKHGSKKGWAMNVVGKTSDGTPGASFQVAVKGGSAVIAVEASNLPTNTWLHLVGVYEPGTAVRMYVNGALAAKNTQDVPENQHNSDWDVTIGSGPDPASRCYFRGIIDEVCIYDRALTDDEIVLIYESVRAMQRQWH